ncbi:MAG: hypothetical protein IKZ59_03620 [Clostridia bacterium]|nr:hypothetical protein [Clostridia bacterium]
MEIAAALLAGGVTFFAGFMVGLYPPSKHKAIKRLTEIKSEQNKFFENFLSYSGDIQP